MLKFLKFLISSFSASLIDLGCFTLLNLYLFSGLPMRENVFLSTFIARTVSAFYNFCINRKVVFKADQEKSTAGPQLIKYILLVVGQMFASAGLVYVFTKLSSWNSTIVKGCADTSLFIVSYLIQNLLIFRNRKEGDPQKNELPPGTGEKAGV